MQYQLIGLSFYLFKHPRFLLIEPCFRCRCEVFCVTNPISAMLFNLFLRRDGNRSFPMEFCEQCRKTRPLFYLLSSSRKRKVKAVLDVSTNAKWNDTSLEGGFLNTRKTEKRTLDSPRSHFCPCSGDSFLPMSVTSYHLNSKQANKAHRAENVLRD